MSRDREGRLLAARVEAKNSGVGPSAAPEGDDSGGLIIRDAAANELQQRLLAHARVFEIRQGSTGKNRLAGGAPARYLRNNLIGQACKAHGHSFAAPQADLVEPREFENRGFRNARLQQFSDVSAGMKLFLAAAGQAHERDTAIVRKSTLLGLYALGDFSFGDSESLQGLDGRVTHARVVERDRVGWHYVMAAAEEQECGGEKRHVQKPRPRGATIQASRKGRASHLKCDCRHRSGCVAKGMSEVITRREHYRPSHFRR